MQLLKKAATLSFLFLTEVFLLILIQNIPLISSYLPVHSALIWMPLSILITVNFFLIWKLITDVPQIKELISLCVDKFKVVVEKLCVKKRSALCLGVFCLGFLVCLAYMVFVSKCTYVDHDTETYLFQARLFVMGKMHTPSPPNVRFVPTRHLNSVQGKVYQLFSPGNAFFLALGEFFHIPWIVPPILSGITLIFVFLFVDTFTSRKAALLTAFLMLISPSFYAIGGAWWGENVSRCFLAISLYFFLKSIFELSLKSAIISGLCWGIVLNTRPVPAAVFGVLFAVFGIYFIIINQQKRRLMLNGILMSVVSLWGVALFLAVNYYYTGNLFKTPHDVEQKYTTLGFGVKAVGVNPDLSKVYDTPFNGLAYNYTPLEGAKRIVKNILPSVGMNMVGWGFPENIYRFNFITAILAYVFIVFQLVKFKDRLDIFLIAMFLATVFFLFFYAYDACTWDTLAVGARYYNECIIIGLIPLLAKGIINSKAYFQKLADRFSFQHNSLQFGLVILLTINWGFFTATQINYGLKPVLWELRQQVAQIKPDNTVIFVKGDQIPLGNVPYEEFEQRKVVYFRLLKAHSPWVFDQRDPSKPDDWREFYPKYFKGRTPFLWDGKRLIKLVT